MPPPESPRGIPYGMCWRSSVPLAVVQTIFSGNTPATKHALNMLNRIPGITKSVYIGWKRCRVIEDVYITRCSNCSQYGHKSNVCENNQVCPVCSKNHDLKSCNNRVKKCNNCVWHNKTYHTNFKTNHCTFENNLCEYYKNQKRNIKSKICYKELEI